MGKSIKSDYTLDDNAKIAVIGGGPSGSLFSIFALKMAKMIDKKIDVTIFEPKDFTRDGPIGCNRCGGVISEHLVQALAVEGINIPPEVVQRGINSYVLHTQRGDVHIESPAAEKRIATVYRGGGPRGIKEKERESFDNFLLNCAIQEGASHARLRIDGIKNNDKPVITSGGKDIMEADLIVGAFGVNSTCWKIFEGLDMGYKKPETTSAFITELELGHETVSENFGSSIHFFLIPEPKNIKFAALIPKGRYVTLCILGKDIEQQTVTGLLNTPIARKLLPDNVMSDKFCKCFPKLSLTTAERGFADRMVVIGDAGSTRLFKDGIGASYIMGKAAATTSVLHGVGKEHFSRHYLPVYNRTRVDNIYGRFVYLTTNAYKNVGPLTESMVNVVKKEQQKRDEAFPRLSSMLWDTFTGNETYKNIFLRGTYIGMHVKLGWEFLKAIARRTT
jgi:flavin-dependent dehydrogenase